MALSSPIGRVCSLRLTSSSSKCRILSRITALISSSIFESMCVPHLINNKLSTSWIKNKLPLTYQLTPISESLIVRNLRSYKFYSFQKVSVIFLFSNPTSSTSIFLYSAVYLKSSMISKISGWMKTDLEASITK